MAAEPSLSSLIPAALSINAFFLPIIVSIISLGPAFIRLAPEPMVELEPEEAIEVADELEAELKTPSLKDI